MVSKGGESLERIRSGFVFKSTADGNSLEYRDTIVIPYFKQKYKVS
jgi:hypothetical protein